VIAAGSALLISALVTDTFYTQTLLFQWSNFSIWLITGGLVLAGLAALALCVDLMLGRAGPIDRPRFGMVACAALLSLLNAFVHSRDAYTAIVPQGLALSGVVALILLVILGLGCRIAPPGGHSDGDRP
jgi:uncharacterized membrane protein